MMTPTEKSISQSRKARGILVPIFEELMREPIGVQDDGDRNFLAELVRRRSTPRVPGIYSPSMLGSCQRQAYFVKTGKERKPSVNKKLNSIFYDGDWRHFKLQFALWKAHRREMLVLHGCEVFVRSQKYDFGGTLDAIAEIDGVPYIIDFKGMNTSSFLQFVSGALKFPGYEIQITGYGMILNENPNYPDVEKMLLVAENKNGPVDRGSPVGLYEKLFDLKEMEHEVLSRLVALEEYEERSEIPPPACVSVNQNQFIQCAFGWWCRGEVEKHMRKVDSKPKKKKAKKVSYRRSARGGKK